MISIIAALAENRVIGVNNTLPWRLPNDLKRFRRLTTGHAIVMGRKNYESIGKPLPERTNIVITRNRDYRAPGCLVAHSLDEALALASATAPGDVQEAQVSRETGMSEATVALGRRSRRGPTSSIPGVVPPPSMASKNDPEIFVIGGAEIYRAALACTGRLYLTRVHATIAGDTYFPEFDKTEWREISRERHERDERHAHAYSFVVSERVKPTA